MHLLQQRTEQRLNILFGIFCNLLELVNGKHHRLLLRIEKFKQPFQRGLFFRHILEFKGELRTSRKPVVGNDRTEVPDITEKFPADGCLFRKPLHYGL